MRSFLGSRLLLVGGLKWGMDTQTRLKSLEEQLAKYRPKYLEAKRKFRGVRHEDSLSELRYTEFMVYKNMVEGLEKEIIELKERL